MGRASMSVSLSEGCDGDGLGARGCGDEVAHLRRRRRRRKSKSTRTRRVSAEDDGSGMEGEDGVEVEVEVEVEAVACDDSVEDGVQNVSREEGLLSCGALDDGVKKVEEEVRLMLWAELAPWQQHGSELILTGYRKISNSAWACLHSWTYLHNETVNIHSHVAGALLFACLPVYLASSGSPPRYALAAAGDLAVCAVYFVGVAVCFVLSAAFHTFSSHSEEAYRAGMRADVRGILLLMWSATVPLAHFSFPPSSSPSSPLSFILPFSGTLPPLHLGWREVYWTLTTILALACAAAVSRPHPYPQSPSSSSSTSNSSPSPFAPPDPWGDHWHRRAALFALFGVVSFAAPIAHGALLHLRRHGGTEGPSYADLIGGTPWILATAAFNALGFAAYTFRFPERRFPRTFDLLGASHQLMHVAVLAAALSWAVAVVRALDLRCGLGGGAAAAGR